MTNKLRQYPVAGRVTAETADDREAATYESDIFARLFQEPKPYRLRIQIAAGEQFNAVKLVQGEIHRLRDAFDENTEYTSRQDGQIYTEQKDTDGSRNIEKTGVYYCITPYNNGGLEIQLGDSEICGAEVVLTSDQRTDFERVLGSFENKQMGFTPLFDNRKPQRVSPDGEFTPIQDIS